MGIKTKPVYMYSLTSALVILSTFVKTSRGDRHPSYLIDRHRRIG